MTGRACTYKAFKLGKNIIGAVLQKITLYCISQREANTPEVGNKWAEFFVAMKWSKI